MFGVIWSHEIQLHQISVKFLVIHMKPNEKAVVICIYNILIWLIHQHNHTGVQQTWYLVGSAEKDNYMGRSRVKDL